MSRARGGRAASGLRPTADRDRLGQVLRRAAQQCNDQLVRSWILALLRGDQAEGQVTPSTSPTSQRDAR